MAIYIIPIFCFGLVISGIVFLGIQEASELAKRLAAETDEAPLGSNNLPASSRRGPAPNRPSGNVIQP